MLLFDGFDELVTRVTYDRAADHLETLLPGRRGQGEDRGGQPHPALQAHAQVLTALGERVGLLPHRRVLAVEDFTRRADPRLPGQPVRRRRAGRRRAARADRGHRATCSGCPATRACSASSPTSTSDGCAPWRAPGRHVSAAGLYQEILDSWLGYEEQRTAGGARRAAPGLSAGRAVARRHRAGAAAVGERRGVAAAWPSSPRWPHDARRARPTGGCPPQQAVHAVGAGSLLVRTEEACSGSSTARSPSGWSPSAIAGEFNAGVAAARGAGRTAAAAAGGRLPVRPRRPGRAARPGPTACSATRRPAARRTNALQLSARLRHRPTDLRGAVLRGEDLSTATSAGVDLTGADLTEPLVGANLTRRDLRNARLGGARLDGARLAGADLRGADLGRRPPVPRRPDAARRDRQPVEPRGADRRDAADARTRPGAARARRSRPARRSAPSWRRPPSACGTASSRAGQASAGAGLQGRTAARWRSAATTAACWCATRSPGCPLRTLQGHRGRVFAVVHARDVLVTGSSDGTVRLWDAGHRADAPRARRAQRVGVAGRAEPGRGRRGHRRRGGRRAAVGHGDRQPAVPDARAVAGSSSASPSTRASSRRPTATAWCGSGTRPPAPRPARCGSPTAPCTGWCRPATCWSRPGPGAALSGWDTVARVSRVVEFVGHTDDVLAVDPHPDEPLLASGDAAGHVRHLGHGHGRGAPRARGPRRRHLLRGLEPSGRPGSPAATARARSASGTPRPGGCGTGSPAHTGSVWPFAFRPDGGQLAVSDDQLTTRLWDPAPARACTR